MSKYFKVPFAMNGDRKEIPTDKQDDGSISFDEGYGADYEKNKQVDPTAKDISRQEFNSVLHDITGAIGEIQRSGVATWTNEISYNKGATIIHNGAVYTSTINANKNEPPHSSWSSLDLSEYRKKDDLLFKGMMQVQATDDVGTGVFLQCPDGKVRGQMIYNNYGLQFAQIQEDDTYQTFTFPRHGEGGEIAINHDSVSLEDYGGSIGNANNSMALQAALNSGKLIDLKGGTYKANGIIEVSTINSGIVNGVIDASEGELKLIGKEKKLGVVSADDVRGIKEVKVSFDVSDVESGDVIILFNPKANSLSPYRDYRDGCMLLVDTVKQGMITTANDITLESIDVVGSTYDVHLLKKQSITLKDFGIIPKEDDFGINLSYFTKVNMYDVYIKDTEEAYCGYNLQNCFNTDLNGFEGKAKKRDAYPLHMASCQEFTIERYNGYGDRHALGLGSRGSYLATPTRFGRVFNSYLKASSSSKVTTGDLHGNCINITYSDCVFYGSAPLAGKDNTIKDSEIFALIAGLSPLYGSEFFGGYICFNSVTIHTNNSTILALGGDKVVGDRAIVLDNIDITQTSSGETPVDFMSIYTTNGSGDLSIHASNIRFHKKPNFNRFLYVRESADSLSSNVLLYVDGSASDFKWIGITNWSKSDENIHLKLTSSLDIQAKINVPTGESRAVGEIVFPNFANKVPKVLVQPLYQDSTLAGVGVSSLAAHQLNPWRDKSGIAVSSGGGDFKSDTSIDVLCRVLY